MVLLLLASLLAAPAPAAGNGGRGETLFLSNCMACHGKAADGKGPAAAALTPPPADFTSAAFWKGRTDESIAASIKAGRPGTSMMAFSQLSDADVADIVAFLRTKAP